MGWGVVAIKNQGSAKEFPNADNANMPEGFDEAAIEVKDQ